MRSPAIDFMGRERNLVTVTIADGDRLVLTSVPTLEALSRFESIPDVPRPQFRYQVETGAVGSTAVVLHVECFAVGDEAWQKRMRTHIRSAVYEELPKLADAAESGHIDFRVELHARSELTVSIGMR